jgi:hypothetical protein
VIRDPTDIEGSSEKKEFSVLKGKELAVQVVQKDEGATQVRQGTVVDISVEYSMEMEVENGILSMLLTAPFAML